MSFPFQNNFNSTYGNGYGFNNPYGNYMPQQQNTQAIPMPPKTTKVYVTSQEEALARQADPNSQIPYFHQNGKVLFDVFTDQWGRKQVQAYNLVPIEQTVQPENALREELQSLKMRMEKIESVLPSLPNLKPETIEVKNVQSERTE